METVTVQEVMQTVQEVMCVWWGSTEAGKPTVALIGRMARKLGARSWIGCRDEGADRLLCLPLRGVCAGNWRTTVTGFGLEVDASDACGWNHWWQTGCCVSRYGVSVQAIGERLEVDASDACGWNHWSAWYCT